jgi:hypothetical protein
MKRATRLATAVCVCASVAAGLGGCGEDELRDEIAAEMEAATDGSVLDFQLADNHGNSNRVTLGPPEGESEVSAADMAAAIAVIDSRRADKRLVGNGPPRLVITAPQPGGRAIDVGWRRTDDGKDWELDLINGQWMAYGPWMCQIPGLRRLTKAAPGSDFSQIGECTPGLEDLAITSWDESTGLAGLEELDDLRGLSVEVGLRDIHELPSLSGLEDLWIPDSFDTPGDRAYLESRYPGCNLWFITP